MKSKLLIPFLLLLSLQVNAVGHVRDAVITRVYCGYQDTHNMCAVILNKDINTPDECHTIDSNQMQFRGDGSMGNALLSLALTAHTTQKKVHVYSTGTCNIYKGLPDVQYIEIRN